MKKYYKGNINTVYIKNLCIDKDKISNIDLGHKVLEKDVLFYENFLGVIVRADDGYPTLEPSEAEYLVCNDVKRLGIKAANTSCQYYDLNSFKSTEISKEEEKVLALKRRKNYFPIWRKKDKPET